MMQYILYFFTSLIATIFVMPLVMKLAEKFNILDKPAPRKVHKKPIPRLGGLAIALGVTFTYFVGSLYAQNITGITVGALIIILTGLIDDKYQISPKLKLFGQSLAAFAVIGSGLTIQVINIPFLGVYDIGYWGMVLTWFWIVGISNAINLIDGLDGLAGGVSAVIISTIAIMAFIGGKPLIFMLALTILGAIIGFLFFNFHPAKIFMGDTGSLFIGYSIAVLSILGLFKSVTLFGFVFPIVLLGVPILDTAIAIVRRIVHKQPISMPDKNHLHHCLLKKGFSHRQAVLIIYGISIFFSVIAVILSNVQLWAMLIISFVLLFVIILFAEYIGMIDEKRKPILTFCRKILHIPL